jgi:hypothetical protein
MKQFQPCTGNALLPFGTNITGGGAVITGGKMLFIFIMGPTTFLF